MSTCIQCEKKIDNEVNCWEPGQCCIARTIFACCKKCAIEFCKKEKIKLSEIEVCYTDFYKLDDEGNQA